MATSDYSKKIRELLRLRLADPLRPALQPFLDFKEFPSVEDYNRLAHRCDVVSGAGVPIRFVSESKTKHKSGFLRLYQPRIFLLGQVSSRPHHWHDHFEMLAWQTFPLAKAALNRRHFYAFDEIADFPWVAPARYRTTEQDALTIFDEGGMLIAYDDEALWNEQAAQKFAAFGKASDEVKRHFSFFVFGHAVFEEIVKGHFNVNASAIGVRVSCDTLMGKYEDLLSQVDKLASQAIDLRRNKLTTKGFIPVPIQQLL